MNVLVLTVSEAEGRTWQYTVENLGSDWRCEIACTAEQATFRLSEWVDVLLLLGGEGDALLMQLRERPMLAPPYILGEDAPDGELPSVEDLPALLHAWRNEMYLPAMAEQHLQTAANMASALLRAMAVPSRLKAWAFLPEMLAWTVVHPPLLDDLQHGLYPRIGRRCGLTAAAVERRLRLCVESTWMHGSLQALERFFGSSVDPERGKPTNREFLCRMQERITLAMKRLV